MAGLGPTVKLTFAGDDSALSRTLKSVEAKTSSLGGTLLGVGKGLSMLSSGAGAVQVIGGAVGAVTQLAGAALLVPGAALAGAAAMQTFKLATAGFGEAVGAGLSGDVEAFAEATKKMHPEMAKAAATAVSFKPRIDALRKSVQGEFWDDFSGGLKSAGDKYLPILEEKLPAVSRSLGGIAWEGLRAAQTPFFTGAVSSILDSTTGMLDGMATSAGDVATGVVGIGKVGASYLTRFGTSVGGVATRFKDWVTSVQGQNQIRAWIDQGIAGFQSLGTIVGNIGSTLGSVLRGLGGDTTSFLEPLELTTARIAEFAASSDGQAMLAALGEAMRAAGVLMREVLLSALQALVPVIVTLAPWVASIATTLAGWAPILGPLVVGMLGLYGAFQIVTAGVGIYNAVMAVARAGMVVTAASWVATAATSVASGAMMVASMVATGVVYVAQWAVMAAGAMARAVVMAASWFIALGPVGWVIGAVVGLVALVIANWDTVKSWTLAAWSAVSGAVASAWSTLTGYVSSGVAKIRVGISWFGQLPGLVGGWFGGMVTAAVGQANRLVAFVRGIPRTILAGLSGLGSLLVNSGRSLLEGLWRGIQSALSWVYSNISGALQYIRNLFPFSPAKDGPFAGSGYTTHSGQALMEDFGKGMRSADSDVRSAASSVLGGAQRTLAAAPARAGGTAGGGALQLVVAPGADSALATLIMRMVRTGQIQIKAA